MVYPIYKIFLFSSVAAFLLMVQSTTSDQTDTENSLKELNFRLDEMMKKNLQNDVRIGFLEAKNAQQDREIAELKLKLNSKQDIRLPVPGGSLDKPTVPSSCKDLATSGHSFQGLYLVKNPDTSQIQTVLCGFGTSVFQEVIDGPISPWTKPPATNPTTSPKVVEKKNVLVFHVERDSVKGSFRNVVTYDKSFVNVDSTMNLYLGTFTAPSQGVYYFEARALPGIDLQVNGSHMKWRGQTPRQGQDKDLDSNARITLNAGDRVNLYNSLDVDPVKEFVNWSVQFKGFREE